jgi:hypothetical protein
MLEMFLDYIKSRDLKMLSMDSYLPGNQAKQLDFKTFIFGTKLRCNASVNRIKMLFYHHKLYKHYIHVPSFLLAGIM